MIKKKNVAKNEKKLSILFVLVYDNQGLMLSSGKTSL